jgi:hypothetical protein
MKTEKTFKNGYNIEILLFFRIFTYEKTIIALAHIE